MKKMLSLEAIVPQMLKSLGLAQRFRAELVVYNWRQIVGEDIAAHTRPGKIRRGVMTVAAKSAVWAHHLSTMKEGIISKINAFAGETAVTDLKFQAGYFKNDQNQENDGDEEVTTVFLPPIPLELAETRAIEEIAAPLQNDELRRKFKRMLIKELTLRKARKRLDWQACETCGVLRPPGQALCPTCAMAARAEARGKIRPILREAPWISAEECAQYVGCRPSDFRAEKEGLADELIKELGRSEDDRMKLMTLAMLLNKVGPQSVTEEMINNTLVMVRRKSNVFASRG